MSCSAVNCTNRSSGGIRLFRFPAQPQRRKVWVYNTRRGNWNPTDSSRLCQVLFEENKFEQNRVDGWLKLKWNAVPTIFDVPNPPKSLMATRNSKYKIPNVNKNDPIPHISTSIQQLDPNPINTIQLNPDKTNNTPNENLLTLQSICYEIIKKMNKSIVEILQHLESSLSTEFDYCDVNKSLDFLLRRSFNASQLGDIQAALSSVDAVLEKTWESLHTGSWADASDRVRKLYSHASLLKTKLLLKIAHDVSMLKKAINAVDMGLLMGNEFRKELTKTASLLCKTLQENYVESPELIYKNTNNCSLYRIGDYVPTINQPSLETFLRDFLKPKLPVKIIGNMEHWPAINKWKDLNYFIKLAGSRLVPVEIGSSYADTEWSQKLITLEEFISSRVVQENEKPTYLAQHQLFNQIPELKDDIRVPDYCYLTDIDNLEPDINVWLGPKGTISPTHHDPKNNFLAQVVGSKDVILYDPKWSEYLYPYEDKFLMNTAQIDPIKPDLNKFPNFSKAKALFCTLKEGEMLFIPPGWWHRVESLSVSFSVSFWWV